MPHVTRRTLLKLGGGAAVGTLAAAQPAAAEPETGTPMSQLPEPNVDAARTWWSPQRQVWTPVGWKGHLFRFDVFYNGATICQPAIALPPSSAPTLKPYLTPYKGKDFQVTPVMPDGGGFPKLPEDNVYLYKTDYGVGLQSWQQDVDTPVLRTDWRRQEGLVLRQSQFAHLKGGQAVDTAIEPIYNWTRYEIAHVDELKAPATFEFVLRLSRLYYDHFVGPPQQQEAFLTIQLTPSAAPLAAPLVMDRVWNPEGKPLTVNIRDENGDVRLISRHACQGHDQHAPRRRLRERLRPAPQPARDDGQPHRRSPPDAPPARGGSRTRVGTGPRRCPRGVPNVLASPAGSEDRPPQKTTSTSTSGAASSSPR